MKNMTNEQKTLFLLKIPYINLFKFTKSYNQNFNFIIGISNIYDDDNIELNTKYNNKYYYIVERYSIETHILNKDFNFKFIDLIKIKNINIQTIICGSISIDIKNKTARIISLSNNFEYGDILYQIMLHICKKEKLKKIELTDNSYRKCGDVELSLDYLKTMILGFPHYYKYGFKFNYDEDNKILIENYNNFLNDPKITCKKLLILLKNKNIEKNMIDKINKVLNKLDNEQISIKKIVMLFTSDLTNKKYCNLIHKIYIELFEEAGYKTYYTKDYFFYLK